MSMHWHVQWFDIIVVTFVGPYCKSTNNIIVVLPWNNEVAMNFSPYLHISIIIFNVFCNYLRDRQTYLQVTHDDFLNSRWQLARESIIVSNLNSPVAKKLDVCMFHPMVHGFCHWWFQVQWFHNNSTLAPLLLPWSKHLRWHAKSCVSLSIGNVHALHVEHLFILAHVIVTNGMWDPLSIGPYWQWYLLVRHGVSNKCWKWYAHISGAKLQVCNIALCTLEFKLHVSIVLDEEQITIPLRKRELPLLVQWRALQMNM